MLFSSLLMIMKTFKQAAQKTTSHILQKDSTDNWLFMRRICVAKPMIFIFACKGNHNNSKAVSANAQIFLKDQVLDSYHLRKSLVPHNVVWLTPLSVAFGNSCFSRLLRQSSYIRISQKTDETETTSLSRNVHRQQIQDGKRLICKFITNSWT